MEKRYIDVNKPLEIINDWKEQEYENCSREYNVAYDDALTAVQDLLNEQPAADVKEVARGKWETNSDYPDRLICSRCGYMEDVWWADKGTNFCPSCGADMGGGVDGTENI